jgi:glycosyltransferase involved in cell wall biosynthesis
MGGVSDFTRVVAHGLSARGARVHVWSPAPIDPDDRVIVHPIDGAFPVGTLGAIDRALNEIAGARRLFVQWVPHGYGYKSLNVPFCRWVARRTRRHGDQLDLMVHEPFLPFDVARPRQNVGAVIHRLMLSVLLGAAHRVWVSTPSFVPEIRRFARRRSIPFNWLPVPSPIEAIAPRENGALDTESSGRIGYFGAANPLVSSLLEATILDIVNRRPDVGVVLAGIGTDKFAQQLGTKHPNVVPRVTALGERSALDLSRMIQSCDVFLQPYPDGASARRTTLMALLQHGRAVVTNCGPRTEPWWRQSSAVELQPGSPEALAAAVESLLENRQARIALGARAREMYTTRFETSHTVAALLAATT